MSLEKALNENTETMRELIEVLKESNAGREKALAGVAALKEAKAAQSKPPVDEDDDEPAPKKPAKAEPPKKAEAKPSKKKAPTLDALKSAVGAFLTGPEDWNDLDEAEQEELRNERTDFVVAMLAEVGAAKVSEIGKDDWARCLDYIERKTAGEEVNFGEDEAPKKRASLID